MLIGHLIGPYAQNLSGQFRSVNWNECPLGPN